MGEHNKLQLATCLYIFDGGEDVHTSAYSACGSRCPLCVRKTGCQQSGKYPPSSSSLLDVFWPNPTSHAPPFIKLNAMLHSVSVKSLPRLNIYRSLNSRPRPLLHLIQLSQKATMRAAELLLVKLYISTRSFPSKHPARFAAKIAI